MYQFQLYNKYLEIICICLHKMGIKIVPVFVENGKVVYAEERENYLNVLSLKDLEQLVNRI